MNARIIVIAALAGFMTLLGGCAHYTTPGSPADFRALGITADEQAVNTDGEIRQLMERRPLASFPAAVAVIHVQGSEYQSYSYNGYGRGTTTVITLREAEMDTEFERLARLPMIRGIAPINRLVASPRVNSTRDLRTMAASVQADMALVYTFDTRFGKEKVVPFMGTITLGLFPSEEAQVTSTVSSALIDTRSGYIYGLAEATVKEDQLANVWTTREAIDQSRRRAERKAFAAMVVQLERTWTDVVAQYATPAPAMGADPATLSGE